MTAQQLKNSILQMAVQGKLVPQDPNDEPASVLLERIKAEKQELIKQGKIQKDKKASDIFRGSSRNLPYTFCEQIGKEIRDISDEIPFDIPESWVWCRLGCIVYNRGQMKPTSNFCYVDIGSIDNKNQKLGNTENIITPDKAPSRARKIIDFGDIIYSTVRPYLHNMCIIDRQFSLRPIASTGFATMTCYSGIFNKYLFYYLLAPDFDNYANDTENSKGVAYPAINEDRLYKALIPVPPIEEQHRIVAKIEELLPYIEEYDKAETRLTTLNETFPEALKKSILQEAVQGKLVPQDPNDEPASVLLERIKAEKQRLIKEGKIKKDKHESAIVTRDKIPYEIIDGKERCIADEVPFELPDSWAWCRLKSILNAVSARRVHQSDWKRSGIPFYRAREIAKLADNGYVDNELFISEKLFDEYSKSGIPKSGDIMVTAVGTLGKTYIVKETDKFYYKDASVICLENFSKINSGYIKYLLMSPYMESIIKDNSSGTTVGTITLVKANEYLIPLPPLAEQKRIVARIEELMQYCDKL